MKLLIKRFNLFIELIMINYRLISLKMRFVKSFEDLSVIYNILKLIVEYRTIIRVALMLQSIKFLLFRSWGHLCIIAQVINHVKASKDKYLAYFRIYSLIFSLNPYL